MTRNSQNGYIVTAGAFQEMQLKKIRLDISWESIICLTDWDQQSKRTWQEIHRMATLWLQVTDVQEMQLNADLLCSAKREKFVKVSNSGKEWTGCIMADFCIKFH